MKRKNFFWNFFKEMKSLLGVDNKWFKEMQIPNKFYDLLLLQIGMVSLHSTIFCHFFWNYYLISEYYGSTNCTMRRLPVSTLERITFPSSVEVVSFHISQFLLLFPKAFWELHGVFPVIMRLWLKIPLNLPLYNTTKISQESI